MVELYKYDQLLNSIEMLVYEDVLSLQKYVKMVNILLDNDNDNKVMSESSDENLIKHSHDMASNVMAGIISHLCKLYKHRDDRYANPGKWVATVMINYTKFYAYCGETSKRSDKTNKRRTVHDNLDTIMKDALATYQLEYSSEKKLPELPGFSLDALYTTEWIRKFMDSVTDGKTLDKVKMALDELDKKGKTDVYNGKGKRS